MTATGSDGLQPADVSGENARVRFELAPTASSGEAPLPMTLRHFSTVIAARGVTGQEFDVAPGDYLVSVELPDGSRIAQAANITPETRSVVLPSGASVGPEEAERDRSAALRQRTVDLSAVLSDFAPQGLAAAKRLDFPPLENLTAAFAREYRSVHAPNSGGAPPAEAASKIVAFEARATPGGHFARLGQPLAMGGAAPGLYSITLHGADTAGRFVLFELPQGKFRTLAVAVPAAPGWTAKLMLGENAAQIIAVLENCRANALLSYLVEQSYASVAAYTDEGAAMDLKTLLFEKQADPIGAAIGGYGLLSLNRLSPLNSWSANLMAVAPWLADSFAIHGETQARLGEHQKAAEAFARMIDVGLPVFSLGLSFAATRARLYCQHKLPNPDRADALNRWLVEISAKVLPRLKLGEALTAIANPELDGT